jgi:hypothetical protein
MIVENSNVQPMKEWRLPVVTTYGTVGKITQGCDKMLGGSDGFTFMGTPIQCAS